MRAALAAMIRVIGARTLLTFVLLVLTLAAIAQGVNELVHALDMALLLRVLWVGVLVAWIMARSRIRSWLALILLLLTGLGYIVIDVGQLGGKLGALFQNLNDLIAGFKYWRPGTQISLQPFLSTLSELGANLNTLTNRTSAWLLAMSSGHPGFDPVAASIVWSLALWGIATWAAWAIRRNWHALQAMLPAIVFLAAIYAYTGADALLLIWPAFTLLILMALISHGALEKRWQAMAIDYSEDIRFDIALIVMPVSVLLVGVAYLMPSLSFQDLANAAQEAVRTPAQQAKPLPDSLGLKPKPVAAQFVAAPPVAGMPRSHLIGSGPELSHETVMLVSTGDLPPMPQSISGMYEAPPRYYWRNGVYDRYTGSGWATSDTQSTNHPAGQAIISNTVQAVRLVRQEVQEKTDMGDLVYQAGMLVAADRDLRMYYRTNNDAFSAAFSRASDIYQADSLVSTASVEQLRSVTGEYPDWILKRYLQLPDNTPQRVLSLARDLTATAPTPYDRAVAIETYLRTYSYTLDLPAPPVNRDVADYFLFDLKRGYCDYFATTMVVLARASGLPARMVVGYAAGSYNPMNAEYVVSQADAHSWPEIYFDQYGWIEFEPTSGRATIVRTSNTQIDSGLSAKPVTPLQPRITLLDELEWFVPLSIVLILLFSVPGWLLIDSWRLGRKPPREVVELLFRRLYDQGRKLRVRAAPGDTALEYSSALAQCVSNLAPVKAREAVTRTTTSDLNRLTELYVRNAYSAHPLDALDSRLALQAWQRVRLRLWQAWLWRLRTSLRLRQRSRL